MSGLKATELCQKVPSYAFISFIIIIILLLVLGSIRSCWICFLKCCFLSDVRTFEKIVCTYGKLSERDASF